MKLSGYTNLFPFFLWFKELSFSSNCIKGEYDFTSSYKEFVVFFPIVFYVMYLIRHSDGWVTAYAHNDELLVARGDKVDRGHLIARAGDSGGVQEPQLHFEVRKGTTAVNPLKYLDSS